jgi:hypothetical protein
MPFLHPANLRLGLKRATKYHVRTVSSRQTPPPTLPSRGAGVFRISNSTAQLFLIGGFVGWGIVVGLSLHSSLNETYPTKPGETIKNLLGFDSKKKAKPELQKAISLLKIFFPEDGDVVTDVEVLKAYSATNYLAYIGSEEAKAHAVVVYPRSTQDVVKIVTIADRCGVSIVSKGSGTGLEGHATSVSPHVLIKRCH